MNRKEVMALSAEDCKKCFINAGMRYLRETGLKTKAEQLAWLQEAVDAISSGVAKKTL